jgi:hypothetical protein
MSFRHFNPVLNVPPYKAQGPKGSFGNASLADYIKFDGNPHKYTRAYLKEELKKIQLDDIANIASFFSTKGPELNKSSGVQASNGDSVLAGVPDKANINLPSPISDSLVKLSKLCSDNNYDMVLTNVSDIPANLGNVIEDIVELGTVVIVAGFFFVIVVPVIALCEVEDPEDPSNCEQAFEVDLETLEQKCESNGPDCRDEVKEWASKLVTKVKDVRNGADTDITTNSNAEQLDYMPIKKPLKIYASNDPFKFMKKRVEGEAPLTTDHSYVTTTLPLEAGNWALTILKET